MHADALRLTELPGPSPTALVANLPYNVSVPVLLHLLALLPDLRLGLVMVQAEVADRLAAPPGSKVYGVPSVKAAWYADVRRAGSVGRHVFWPAPNVDSGLVAWTRREPPVTSATREEVFAVVDAAFAHRRKVLRGALRSVFPGEAVDAEPGPRRHRSPDPRRDLDGGAVRPRGRGPGGAAMSPVIVRAAAKVNLHLGVGRVRADGFHPLSTVYQAIGLCDDVTASASDQWQLDMSLPEWIEPGSVPTDGPTSSTARRRCSPRTTGCRQGPGPRREGHPGRRRPGRRLADAAAALVALDRPWDLGTTDDDLLRIAADLGSDVPFALVGGTALGTGARRARRVGDRRRHVVVGAGARPRSGCRPPTSTRHFDKLFPDASDAERRRAPLLGALRTGEAGQPGPRTSTTTCRTPRARPAPRPRRTSSRSARPRGPAAGCVSGSGPTCVFLCESADHARDVAGRAATGRPTGAGRPRTGRRRPRRPRPWP